MIIDFQWTRIFKFELLLQLKTESEELSKEEDLKSSTKPKENVDSSASVKSETDNKGK